MKWVFQCEVNSMPQTQVDAPYGYAHLFAFSDFCRKGAVSFWAIPSTGDWGKSPQGSDYGPCRASYCNVGVVHQASRYVII